MEKIKDGIYRAMRCDASGYVYGSLATPNWPRVPKNQHYIKVHGQYNWIVPIKIETLVRRFNGKWQNKLNRKGIEYEL